ncbi:MAG: laminin G domain-containing protein [Victivallaceae bacterium]|nr:laminin G domain-containing protein [Victivallaceae bacterium]
MSNVYEQIGGYISSDHHHMTLAACRTLPAEQREMIKREAGLLIRYFCELPDCGWSIFGTLGKWEINNRFSYDIRRDLNASFYLGWNPVTGTGKRFGHDTSGGLEAVPFLLGKAVAAMQAGNLRDGLAMTGAACHYLQDAVTFPEQQALHRRSMNQVLAIDHGDYRPQILFTAAGNIAEAAEHIYTVRVKPLLSEYAGGIRQAIFTGDFALRRRLHNQCDLFGAHITADILHTVLQFYKKAEETRLQVREEFVNIDEEGLPAAYFIDRDDSEVFQGYAAVEGNHPRGFDLRLTPGLQLRLSAVGAAEVRWKQSIVNSILVAPGKYRLQASVYALDSVGDNGLRLVLYDSCWEPVKNLCVLLENGTGWKHVMRDFDLAGEVNAVRLEFFSRNNAGTLLLDHWEFSGASSAVAAGPAPAEGNVRLELRPASGYYQRDISLFGSQNDPITSIRENMAACITDGDEFVFDGESFIEIPWHPHYSPLQVKGTFELELMFLPESTGGELMMSATTEYRPLNGWRLFLKNGRLGVGVYNGDDEYVLEIKDYLPEPGKWHSVNLKLSPDNVISVTLDDMVFSGKAGFPRTYSNTGHFIGSCAGVGNFFTGRIRNLRILTS